MALHADLRVDWRLLFDALRIPWRDRGPNTSRGNINICCPWCYADPSFHLSVAEDKLAYYCFRDPRHRGANPVRLLRALGVARFEAQHLLRDYRLDQPARAPEAKPLVRPAQQWHKFLPATESARCLAYLRQRGFRHPVGVVRRYDLRFAAVGRWAARLLLPCREAGQVVGWTGRALCDTIKPKYLTEHASLYIPDETAATQVIVEGPLDALKISVAMEGLSVAGLALCGKQVSAAKILKLKQLPMQTGYLALDSDAPLSITYQIIRELALVSSRCYIKRLRLPPVYKDPGEMAESDIQTWLENSHDTRMAGDVRELRAQRYQAQFLAG